MKFRAIAIFIVLEMTNCLFGWTSMMAANLDGDEEVSQAEEFQKQGDQVNAVNKYLEAIEKFKDSKRDLPLSWALRNLGDLYAQQGKLTEAASSYERAYKVRNDVVSRGTDDNNNAISSGNKMSLAKDTALIMVALGSVYTRQKDFAKARSTLFDALSKIKISWGPEHDCTGVALSAIGDLNFAQGKFAEAANFYKQAIAIRRKYHSSKELGVLMANYASVNKLLPKTSKQIGR